MPEQDFKKIIYIQSSNDYYSKKIFPIVILMIIIIFLIIGEYLQPFDFVNHFKLSMIMLAFDFLVLLGMAIIFHRTKRILFSKRFIIFSDGFQIPNNSKPNLNKIFFKDVIKTEIHLTPTDPSYIIGVLFITRFDLVKNKDKIVSKKIEGYEFEFKVPNLKDNEYLFFIDSEDISENDFSKLLEVLLDKNLINNKEFNDAKEIKKVKPMYW